ncbi:PH domain-containing protein [Halohasta litorea]|uniref:PH domain-containing protein n=1 Tax=Halohasta litorea TaxID=869891 RepID=A0ABD6D8E4_9EURY|nr:PH domain-containing protein [Halohasta litorea]
MSDDWRWLRESETEVWEGRPRLTTIAGSVVVGLAILVGAGWLAATIDPRLAAVGLLGPVLPAWAYLYIQRTTYLVTTRAIWVKTGVLGLSVRRITLSKVQNTAYEQSIRGSIFGYGTVTVEVAGGDDIDFRRISDPGSVQEAINDQIDRGDAPELPGSPEQWQAVLSAVREVRERFDNRPPARE